MKFHFEKKMPKYWYIIRGNSQWFASHRPFYWLRTWLEALR